ncbi:hypothetical protein B0I37DRAFT_440966 [Chaetomium sp. MPI-CAGE-AT-0009]|nr:hypothetical protein B0I37DRAFT_440966 [Chaetomium sp. MPI-CAGE-AT-0009]
MATRQERMRDRMRGAGRHNVGDIDFGFIIPVAEEPIEEPEEPEEPPVVAPSLAPPPATRPSPNTSAKRKHLDRDVSRLSPTPAGHPTTSHDVYSIPDASTEAGEESTAHPPPSTILSQAPSSPRHTLPPPHNDKQDENEAENEDHPMADAPPLSTATKPPPQHRHPQQQRGPLSSVISATKRLSFDPSSPPAHTTTANPKTTTTPNATRRARPTRQHDMETEMEVTESPADAPGSGRRRPLRVGPGTPVVGSSALLQRVLEEEDLDAEGDVSMGMEVGSGAVGNSSPIERRVARRRSGELRRAVGVVEEGVEGVEEGLEEEVEEVEEEIEEEVEEEVEETVVEESTVQLEDGQTSMDEVQAVVEQEEDEAQEVGEKEAAQQLGRKRPRRSLPAPSPELGSGAVEDSPAPKRRRRKAAASPAQQQQPAKKARVGRPPKSQPPRQPSPSPQPEPPARAQPKPKPKPRAKKQARKSKAAGDGDDSNEERPSGSVPVTVQRFTKPPRAAAGAEGEDGPSATLLNGEIPFTSRGGVNAIDVLSKLCEELIEAYMDKLQERGRAAEDAATRREQKTMYRALEAFQEELRTRLLEHTIALDTLHSLRKRVRAVQKEKLTLRDEILQIRAEREQVALRMDAIRIRHEAESKQALRHISLSSTMHDIDMAVEKGQAAPELSPAEQKKADLANLELLISRVADQACTRGDGGGALKQIREFNAFLERAAAVLEGR